MKHLRIAGTRASSATPADSRIKSRSAARPCGGPAHRAIGVPHPLPLELNRRLVAKSRHSEVFSAVNASVGPPHFFVISSNMTTINTRTTGSVLTLHRHFHLSPWIHWLEVRREARKGPLALWHKESAAGSFRPSGSRRRQRSGVGPCFRDAGPCSKAKPSARRSRARNGSPTFWHQGTVGGFFRPWQAPSRDESGFKSTRSRPRCWPRPRPPAKRSTSSSAGS